MRIKQARKVCEPKWMPEEVILEHITTCSMYGAICADTLASSYSYLTFHFSCRVSQKKKASEDQAQAQEPKTTAVHHLGMDVMAAVKIKGLLRKRRYMHAIIACRYTGRRIFLR